MIFIVSVLVFCAYLRHLRRKGRAFDLLQRDQHHFLIAQQLHLLAAALGRQSLQVEGHEDDVLLVEMGVLVVGVVEEGLKTIVVPEYFIVNEGCFDVAQHPAHTSLVALVLFDCLFFHSGHISHKSSEVILLVEDQRIVEQTDSVQGKQVLQDYLL